MSKSESATKVSSTTPPPLLNTHLLPHTPYKCTHGCISSQPPCKLPVKPSFLTNNILYPCVCVCLESTLSYSIFCSMRTQACLKLTTSEELIIALHIHYFPSLICYAADSENMQVCVILITADSTSDGPSLLLPLVVVSCLPTKSVPCFLSVWSIGKHQHIQEE